MLRAATIGCDWLHRIVHLGLLVALGAMPTAVCTGCLHVIGLDTPYYEQGPRQEAPPEGEFKAGTGVWIVGEKDGYRRVWASNGVLAYVWPRAITTREEWQRRQQAEKEAEQADMATETPPPAETKR